MSAPKSKGTWPLELPAELVEAYRTARGIVLRNGIANNGTGVTRDQWERLARAALDLAEYTDHRIPGGEA